MPSSTLKLSMAVSSLAALLSAAPIESMLPAGNQAPDTTGFQNATIHVSRGGQAVCVSGFVPVTASAHNLKVNFEVPETQAEVSQTFLNLFTPGSSFASQLVTGTQEISGTYNIAAKFCTPANVTQPQNVYFLTHGGGFDGTYWDFAPDYSYVDFIVNQGSAAFFYDRLGIGQSVDPNLDPINDIQGILQVAIAAELARQLRAGAFSHYTPQKVIGVGHSLGSVVTQGVTALEGGADLFDAAILTGFGRSETGQVNFLLGLNGQIAAHNDPSRFQDLSNGYLVAGSAISNQIGFLHYPGFDPEILPLVEANKGVFTFGEFFTLNSVISKAANFTGPVALVNGVADLPICGGNCSLPTDPAAALVASLYPNAKNVSGGNLFLIPETGHGITLHHNAVLGHQFIADFVRRSGL